MNTVHKFHKLCTTVNSINNAMYGYYDLTINVSWLKVTSKEPTCVHFPCTRSEQMKLIHFLTNPD